MKNIFIKNVWAIVLAGTVISGLNGQSKSGDVMLDAMHDELERNMKELKLPESPRPCFILYGALDQKSYMVAATMGSLINYSELPVRVRTSSRVLVGDFHFNDESLDDNHYSSPTVHEIELPVDDDYLGIRRSFWSITDEVYRGAAKDYQKNQQTLKESGKELKDHPHRYFEKSQPVKIIEELKPYSWNKEKYVALARNLSSEFIGHPEITNSRVIITFAEEKRYITSSEGTSVRTPSSRAGIAVMAQLRLESGETFYDQREFDGATPDDFPDEQFLRSEIGKLIASLKASKQGARLEEDYSGPVLVTGTSVARAFMNAFLNNRESIISGDELPQKKSGYRVEQGAGLENKIGNQIAHESLTIKVRPALKEFNGTKLFGHFKVDDEGFVPPDEVLVIENGILKTLLNDRTSVSTITHKFPSGFASGVGVLEVTSGLKNTEKELKDKLLKKAKEEGLEFGLIVRSKSSTGMGGYNVFKVYVDDGREELVSDVQVDRPSLKSMRKLLGASDTYKAYNLMPQFTPGGSPNLTSVIVPDAILLDEIDANAMNDMDEKETQYVTNPLMK